MERFGFAAKVTDLSSVGEGVSAQNSESSSLEAGEESSGASVEVHEGTASLLTSITEPSLQSGQVVLVGGGSQQQNSSQNFSSSTTGSLQDMSTGRQELASESVVVKRLSSGGRLSRHRHSDGGRISLDAQGVFSGHRTGSVEDFMPDDMRRLMNIEMVGSGSKSRTSGSGSGSGRLDRTITKTTRTITTKRTSQDGNSIVSVTETITNPDGSVTTISSTDLEMEETIPEGKGLGSLSTGQLDLSKITSDDTPGADDFQGSVEESENGGIKDSGYYDASTMSTVSESSSYPGGLDMSAMGSLERRQLKSIMKKSKSDSANPKRGISFADTVIGGSVELLIFFLACSLFFKCMCMCLSTCLSVFVYTVCVCVCVRGVCVCLCVCTCVFVCCMWCMSMYVYKCV